MRIEQGAAPALAEDGSDGCLALEGEGRGQNDG
jgi:hypothetical protein